MDLLELPGRNGRRRKDGPAHREMMSKKARERGLVDQGRVDRARLRRANAPKATTKSVTEDGSGTALLSASCRSRNAPVLALELMTNQEPLARPPPVRGKLLNIGVPLTVRVASPLSVNGTFEVDADHVWFGGVPVVTRLTVLDPEALRVKSSTVVEDRL